MIDISETFSKRLSRARRLVVFTGAGISAESGVPTFRGNEGIWKKFDPEELATFSGFQKNPELVWEWYRYRKEIMSAVRPNAAHEAIAALEKFYHVSVITQNIDNLHSRSGSTRVFELHGNIERNFCLGCGTLYRDQDLGLGDVPVPRCKKCSGLIRPDVVWFGELLPEQEWNESVKAAGWADVFLCVGTSGVVYPAASIPAVARRSGAYVVEVNVEPTELTSLMNESLFGAAGEVLPRILETVVALSPGGLELN